MCLASAAGSRPLMTVSSSCPAWTGARSMSSLPEMIRDTSRMSSMSCACSRAFRPMTSSAWRIRSGDSPSPLTIWTHPRIALSGVRSSCESVARNSSLSRLASSAEREPARARPPCGGSRSSRHRTYAPDGSRNRTRPDPCLRPIAPFRPGQPCGIRRRTARRARWRGARRAARARDRQDGFRVRNCRRSHRTYPAAGREAPRGCRTIRRHAMRDPSPTFPSRRHRGQSAGAPRSVARSPRLGSVPRRTPPAPRSTPRELQFVG